MTEDPARSPAALLEQAEYPVWREALVNLAAEQAAPPDVINLFKSLPRGQYDSKEAVMRDFAEAARRFGMGGARDEDDGANRDRRNIGRDAVESAPEGRTRHP